LERGKEIIGKELMNIVVQKVIFLAVITKTKNPGWTGVFEMLF